MYFQSNALDKTCIWEYHWMLFYFSKDTLEKHFHTYEFETN